MEVCCEITSHLFQTRRCAIRMLIGDPDGGGSKMGDDSGGKVVKALGD
jgi:hypothetical protein